MRVISAILLVVLGAGAYHLIAGKHAEKQPSVPEKVTAEAPEANPLVMAEGRVSTYPGAEVIVASENPGIVKTIRVHELEVVHKGQVLAELRNADLLAAQEEAEARIREAEADIRLAHVENGRASDLVQRQFISRQALDRSERDVSATQARLASARAVLKRIQAQLLKTTILAPIGGTVVVRHVDDGEALREGGAVVTLADLAKLRIEAEVDEFDIGRVHTGDIVKITAEGFDGMQWRGRVEEMPDAVRERGMRPQDVARPTDARVLLVKIGLEENIPLKLGQRVEVVIDTKAPKVAYSVRQKPDGKAI